MLNHNQPSSKMSFGTAVLGAVLSVVQSASAQQTVQLPVVSSTSVNTTVSVPDRGSVFLGGVSSASSGRNQYGPIRPGTSSGLERQATSMSVNVYIHDMQAMDEALLNSAPARSSPRDLPIGNRSNAQSRTEPQPVPEASPAEKAAKFEQLAKRSETAGKLGVAKLHWQAAAKYGSKVAESRLAELNQTSSASANIPPSPKTAAR